MEISKKEQHQATIELFRLIIEKCYRMNLLKDLVQPEDLCNPSLEHDQRAFKENLENNLSNTLIPRINKLLRKGLPDLYHMLYTIDVSEEEIKDKIMDLENTSMIPPIIAFAIIDRLKKRYRNYPLLKH